MSVATTALPLLQPQLRAAHTQAVAPLIDALTDRRAVVFAGAGISKPAGFPLWGEFLQQCLERGSTGDDPARWEMARRCLDQGDYLMTAELVQMLWTLMPNHIQETFNSPAAPTLGHRSIARLPFSLAVTTNYDDLLRRAFQEVLTPRVSAYTSKHQREIMDAIRAHTFAVINTHGDAADRDTLVLTRSHYRDAMNNDPINLCVKYLLLFRTFLFVGYSLRDHDLLRLFDEMRLMFGASFGPHYALLYDLEIDETYCKYLRDAYAIHVIPLTMDAARPSYESALVGALTDLSGQVALRMAGRFTGARLDDPLFNLRAATRELLSECRRLTGSYRCEVCLIESETLHRLVPVAEVALDGGSGRYPTSRQVISPSSVVGRLFLKRNLEADYVSVPDVVRASAFLAQQGFEDAVYDHPAAGPMGSLLACPVYADGHRVGVISIESTLRYAYTADHRDALVVFARTVGWIYYEARQRTRLCATLAPYYRDFGRFTAVMGQSRLLSWVRLKYILYDIDYEAGIMRAVSDQDQGGTGEPFVFPFTHRSLATRILVTREHVLLEDAQAECQRPQTERIIDPAGCHRFGIRGPVMAMPVVAGGHTVSVLVAWSGRQERSLEAFRQSRERAKRMVSLVASDPGIADPVRPGDSVVETFVRAVNDQLAVHDKKKLWTRKQRKDPRFQQTIIRALLRAAIDRTTGLLRVRLWRRVESGFPIPRVAFVCTHSEDRDNDYNLPTTADRFAGVVSYEDDPYCQYTLHRYTHDPYARVQHPSMFDQADPNATLLRKDPTGSWIVAPIVHSAPGGQLPTLLGFLSADTHYPEPLGTTDQFVELSTSGQLRQFQLRALDLLTDLLQDLLPHVPPVYSGQLRSYRGDITGGAARNT